MVTVAQRDVLLELASGGLALTKDFDREDPIVKEDRKIMSRLRKKFLMSEDNELDFYECVKEIKALRAKYE